MRLAVSTAQIEDYVDRGFDFDGLVVEQVRLVTPGSHGVQRGLLQHYRAAYNAQVLNGPGLGDGGLQYDGPFNARRDGDCRIPGNRLVNQQSFHYRTRHTHRMVRCGTDVGERTVP